ncbi:MULTISPECIES: PAS domain S-box protein [Pseudanabaena]|uniref:PAS domain S-box protein n=1 Tax=Pseudanabaena TaxID=1152 RepID=UPI0024786E2A|nr:MULTISPECIES: PAS domain S-box protein [Pseudanabaena]MEA5489194.1 PAS domain S-box protein [Pseudanabaena sp. CCNP1317]WGS73779.1 PAS domain S-box protein [Pseudanabaena galeata CCNP1313]
MLVQNSIYLDLAIDHCPLIIAPNRSVLDAINLMNQRIEAESIQPCDHILLAARASYVVVVDEQRLIGVFSERDVLQLVQKQVDLPSLQVINAISDRPMVIKRSQIQDLDSMLQILQYSQRRHLPVIDDSGNIIGVATKESILFAKSKLTEDTLANVEAQKRAVLTAIPDLIYRLSIDGIYLECFSSSYVTDLLPSDLDPISKHLSDVLPKELADRKLHLLRQAIATGEIQSFEQQWNIKGKIQYEEVQIVKVNEQEVLTIIRNISDRKRSEEALRESEMRFRSVFDSAAVGISLAALDGKHIAVNQSLCHMLGYTETELQVLTFQEITHPDDLDLDLYHYQKLLNNEIDSFHIEKRFRHKNGQFIWGLMSVSMVRDPQNQPMYDIALIQNINELKNTQQELSKLNQELEIRIEQRTLDLAESETRKQQILNAIPDLLLRLKLDGTCLDCMMPIFPDKEAFIPIKQNISEILAPSVLAEQLAVFNKAIAIGEVQIYEHKLRKYGEWVYEEVRISPCGEDEVLVLVRNISDRKRAEEALQLSNEKLLATNKELERVTRLKDEFLATMSHELRTPLNAILGISEGLLEQVFGELNQRQQNSLKTIQKSGQHLLELINDILDVAKIEAGMFTLEITSVSVRYLCESSLSFVKHQALQKNILLNLTIHDNMPKAIEIDERRMRQLLINLLSNAVKFTPKNGNVTLEAKLVNVAIGDTAVNTEAHFQEHSKTEIHFLVSDTGIGISQDDINKLFQPFMQIDSSLSRQYAGTGLGLNLVKKLAELHGGQVSVESKVGEGSCFTVNLPYESS